ncbi:FAD-dependent monooxygenase [Streptomyces sp. M10(2022)]
MNALDAIEAGDVVRRVGIPCAELSCTPRPGTCSASSPPLLTCPSRFVWRGDLYRTLYDETIRLGIRTRHDKRLVGAQETADRVIAHFDDGTRATADILVGTDGIRSTVRTVIDPAAPQPQYAGLLGFAAQLTDTGTASTQDKLHISYGKRASFGHLVHDDSSGGWFVNLPHPEPMTLAEARAVGHEEWLGVLREAFTGDDRSPAAEMLRRTDPADLLITGPLETMPAVPTWSRGRMVLVGDAVHAASPSSGQGASQAIESSVQLARCLRDLPYGQAFAAYERLRRTRVERIIENATRTNASKAGSRGGSDLKPVNMDWQFTHHIDWAAAVDTGAHAGALHA